MKRGLLAAALALALAGCSVDDGTELPNPSSVEWSNYAPEVKERIDDARRASDCEELQDLFDNADANDAAQRDRVGEGNSDLMAYIDDSLEYAGCYN